MKRWLRWLLYQTGSMAAPGSWAGSGVDYVDTWVKAIAVGLAADVSC